jgi:phosphatidylglycerophosphatase A
MRKRLVLFFATGMGLGYSPFAPGTAGSIPGFLLVWLFSSWSLPFQAAAALVVFFLGVWISNLALEWFEQKDPRQITIDEIASLPITFAGIALSPEALVLGFVLNRLLDIAKPPPAYQSQALPRGWGIMTDDLVSAFYSNILLRILLSFF